MTVGRSSCPRPSRVRVPRPSDDVASAAIDELGHPHYPGVGSSSVESRRRRARRMGVKCPTRERISAAMDWMGIGAALATEDRSQHRQFEAGMETQKQPGRRKAPSFAASPRHFGAQTMISFAWSSGRSDSSGRCTRFPAFIFCQYPRAGVGILSRLQAFRSPVPDRPHASAS